MPVKKTSRSSTTTHESRPFDQRADDRGRSVGRRVIIKIVPEPQPTPYDQPIPSKEILRRRRPKVRD